MKDSVEFENSETFPTKGSTLRDADRPLFASLRFTSTNTADPLGPMVLHKCDDTSDSWAPISRTVFPGRTYNEMALWISVEEEQAMTGTEYHVGNVVNFIGLEPLSTLDLSLGRRPDETDEDFTDRAATSFENHLKAMRHTVDRRDRFIVGNTVIAIYQSK